MSEQSPTSEPQAGATIIALSRFRHDVARALARRGHALLEADDLEAQVRALSTTELFFIIKEMGVDEALPLLRAVPEQLQALCDLDCWEGDTFEPEELDAWLGPFASEGNEALAEAFLSLDEELQVLFLQASVQIYEGPADKLSELPDDRVSRELPGGLFTLVPIGREREVAPLTLVDALMAHSMQDLFALLTAAKWELPSTLEEEAHHFRQGRMMDSGFLPPERAARLFAAPPRALRAAVAAATAGGAALAAPHAPDEASDHGAQSGPDAPAPAGLVAADATPDGSTQAAVLAPGAAPGPEARGPHLPAVFASAFADDSARVCRALAQVHAAHDLARLEGELVYLINAATVGWGLGVRSLADVQRAAGWVRDVLSLGLEALLGEALADDDDALAGAVLGTPMMHLFQVGMAQILPLCGRAQALARQGAMAAWLAHEGPAEDDPEGHDRAFVRGLAQARPVLAGHDAADVRVVQMWHDRAGLADSAMRLEGIAARILPPEDA